MQKIKINEKEYKISFNFGVIKNVTKDCGGITVPQMIERLSMGDLEVISSVLYHGIKFNHPKFDIKEVDTLSLGEVFKSFETIGTLMNDTMPQDKEPKKASTKKKK
ncbi:Uncharacterised protein [uncultured Clostridium sp.]|nr:Uncharacterised protein [uncultured Clostridium sp.]